MPVIGKKLTSALLAALLMCVSACGETNVPHGTEKPETKKPAATTAAKTVHTAISGIIELTDDEPVQTVPEVTEETAAESAETSETSMETVVTVTSDAASGTSAETSAETTVQTTVTTVAAETTVQTTASVTSGTTAAETTSAPAPNSYDPSFFANDYFIGDSIYTGLTAYGYFPDTQVFAKIGLNPQSAGTSEIKGQTAVSKAQSLQPTRIFIMLGSNGLAYMGNEYMANSMKQLASSKRTAGTSSPAWSP